MNYYSSSNSSAWRNNDPPAQPRGPSVVSDNFSNYDGYGGNKWGARGPSIVNDDTRSWGGHGIGGARGPSVVSDNFSNYGGYSGNKWGARGPSIVNDDTRSWSGHGTSGDFTSPFVSNPYNGWADNAGRTQIDNADTTDGGGYPHSNRNTGSAVNTGTSLSTGASAKNWQPPVGQPSTKPAAPDKASESPPSSWARSGALTEPGASASSGWHWAAGKDPATGYGAANTAPSETNGSDSTDGATGGSTSGPTGEAPESTGSGNSDGSAWVAAGFVPQTGSGNTTEETGQTGDTASGTDETAGDSDWVSEGAGNDSVETDEADAPADAGSGSADEAGSGETGSGETDDTASGDAGSADVGNSTPVELDAAQQADNIRFLSSLIGTETPAAADMDRVVGIYNGFRLSPAEMTHLQSLAQNTANRMFATDGQDFAVHAQNWEDYSDEERQDVIRSFFEGMRDELELETTVEFFNTPPTSSGLYSHGDYDPSNDVLRVNTSPQVHETLPHVMTTAFHELVHAYYFKQTSHIDNDDIVELLENGDITYAQALTHLNVFPPLYISEDQHGLVNYMLNPHEQHAFTGQYMIDQAIIDQGFEQTYQIDNENPLFINMKQHEFA